MSGKPFRLVVHFAQPSGPLGVTPTPMGHQVQANQSQVSTQSGSLNLPGSSRRVERSKSASHIAQLDFKAIMKLLQPSALRSLVNGFKGEFPCCRRPFQDVSLPLVLLALVRRYRSSFCKASGVPALGSSCPRDGTLEIGATEMGAAIRCPLVGDSTRETETAEPLTSTPASWAARLGALSERAVP